MKNKDADNDSSDGSDASPYWVGDADWDGLSGFGQKHGAQHVEKGKTCYPSPEFSSVDKFSFTEAEGESSFAEASNNKN